jgi:hypothetical protein
MTLPSLSVLLDDGSGTFPLDITTQVLSLDGYNQPQPTPDHQEHPMTLPSPRPSSTSRRAA